MKKTILGASIIVLIAVVLFLGISFSNYNHYKSFFPLHEFGWNYPKNIIHTGIYSASQNGTETVFVELEE